MDINLNILSWAALIILALYALNGMRRGLILTVFSTFTMIVAMIVAMNVSPQVSKVLQDTAMFDQMSTGIEERLFSGVEENQVMDSVSEQTAVIQSLPLPESLKEALLENNNTQIYEALGINAFTSFVANYIACLIVNALSFMIVFVVVVILLKVIANVLNIISHLPVLHSLNKLGGFVFGLVNGFVLLWIICIAATLFSGTEPGGYIYGQINDSAFLRWIYDNNYLMTIITSLKYLVV